MRHQFAPLKTSLLLILRVLLCTSAASGSRVLSRQLQQQQQELSNARTPQTTEPYQKQQGAANDTLIVYQVDVGLRLTGANFVPFSLRDQGVIVQTLEETLLQYGPATFSTYKEFQPDPAAPPAMRDAGPGVEFHFTVFWVMNKTGEGIVPNTTWASTGDKAYNVFVILTLRMLTLGSWPGVGLPQLKLTYVTLNPALFSGSFTLAPLVVLDTLLAVELADSKGMLTAEQASAVGAAVEGAVVRDYGSLVEVVNYTKSVGEAGSALLRTKGVNTAGAQQGQRLVKLEVSMYLCRENATVASPQCELQILQALLDRMLDSPEVLQQWRAAGIKGVKVAGISERKPPPPLPPAIQPAKGSSEQPWQPWHLDRIDQPELPLDGKLTSNATGAGVNVFIISSGILASHDEFGFLDGAPGSRVFPLFGYKGADPAEDCEDHTLWYGYGTGAASLCCGLNLGAAKNATIHSVRYRDKCLSDPENWNSEVGWNGGGLSASLDAVLSARLRPAVLLIDTWWSPEQSRGDFAAKQALGERLDQFEAANITVIAGAGPDPRVATACDNAIGGHPTVLSVAASDTHDQRVAFGPFNSSCIDMWGPSGGVGTGMVVATPEGPGNYSRIMNRSFGAAAVVVGVAAQYLQQYPDATPAQVRKALQAQLDTPHTVTGTGVATPTTSLLYTDLQQGATSSSGTGDSSGTGSSGDAGGSNDASSEGGGTNTAAIVGGVIAAVAGVAVMAAVVVFVMRARRQRRLGSASLKSESQGPGEAGWEIPLSELEICRRPDGREWVLGEGKFGRVYKAIKGGVQVVAVKKLSQVADHAKTAFVKEIDMMKFLSRDANVTQFYGCCITDTDMMLVSEFLEGGDLRNALSCDATGELQWYRHGKDVMLDIVRGLHFLHANNVIHRDIKPQNVLLDRFRRAKLADVGLAQLLSKDKDKGSAGGFAGTLGWAAPEVILGEPYNKKVDIYSLGMVLWELVTREAPQRGNLRDVLVPAECPQAVADAIQSCLQRDPALRPSARELYTLLLACPPHISSEGSLQTEVDLAVVPSPRRTDTAGTADSWGRTPEPSTNENGSGGSGDRLSTVFENNKPLQSASSWQEPSAGGAASLASMSSSELAMVVIDFEQIEFCTNADGSRVELGAGAFGKVYRVLLDGVQPLAAKAIPVGQDPNIQNTFIREAGLMWRLRHKNVVGLSGVAFSDGQGYLLMELMEGGSLYKLLNARNKSTKQRVFSWYNRGRQSAFEIAKGLHYLHSFKVTHFDLASKNVLLSKLLTAKLADVGLARAMSCTHHSINMDNQGPPGTWAYMAPELILGSRCSNAVDIYSYGILLWELCTGVHPVRGQMRPLKVPEECPEEVSDLCERCMAENPAERPTAKQILETLNKLGAGPGVAAAQK